MILISGGMISMLTKEKIFSIVGELWFENSPKRRPSGTFPTADIDNLFRETLAHFNKVDILIRPEGTRFKFSTSANHQDRVKVFSRGCLLEGRRFRSKTTKFGDRSVALTSVLSLHYGQVANLG
jgi:hypothetical protein